jgi:hypothetical protein
VQQVKDNKHTLTAVVQAVVAVLCPVVAAAGQVLVTLTCVLCIAAGLQIRTGKPKELAYERS